MQRYHIICHIFVIMLWLNFMIAYVAFTSRCQFIYIYIAQRYDAKDNCSLEATPHLDENYCFPGPMFEDSRKGTDLRTQNFSLDEMSAVILKNNNTTTTNNDTTNNNNNQSFNGNSLTVNSDDKKANSTRGNVELMHIYVGNCEHLCKNRFMSLLDCIVSVKCKCVDPKKQASMVFCRYLKKRPVAESLNFMRRHCNCLRVF